MFSLLYSPDIKEYYICKSKNVIQEDDGVCIVAFKAKLIASYNSKNEIFNLQNNTNLILPEMDCSLNKIVNPLDGENLPAVQDDPFCVFNVTDDANLIRKRRLKSEKIDNETQLSSPNDDINNVVSKIHRPIVVKSEIEKRNYDTRNRQVLNQDKHYFQHPCPPEIGNSIRDCPVRNQKKHTPLILKKESTPIRSEERNSQVSSKNGKHTKIHEPFVIKSEQKVENENDKEELQTDMETDEINTEFANKRVTKDFCKRRYYCYFCKKVYSNLPAHLECKHRNEVDVKQFISLPKGSHERRLVLSTILKKSRSEFDKMKQLEEIQKKDENSDFHPMSFEEFDTAQFGENYTNIMEPEIEISNESDDQHEDNRTYIHNWKKQMEEILEDPKFGGPDEDVTVIPKIETPTKPVILNRTCTNKEMESDDEYSRKNENGDVYKQLNSTIEMDVGVNIDDDYEIEKHDDKESLWDMLQGHVNCSHL